MANPIWTLQDAKNRFSAVVEAAATGEPQKVTRRGKWVSVVLSAAEYERLKRLDQANAPRWASCYWRCHRTTSPLNACQQHRAIWKAAERCF